MAGDETFEEMRHRKKMRKVALNIVGIIATAIITFLVLSVVP